MLSPYDISWIILGYAFFSYSSSDQTGGRNKFDLMMGNILDYEIVTSLKFECEEVIIHFHHWLVCLIFYFICYYLGCRSLSNFLLGGIIQGIINYHDWKQIVKLKTS